MLDVSEAANIIRALPVGRRFHRVFEKYRAFTMVPEDVYVGNLQLALKVRDVPGEIVECGTWRGGMIAGMADTLGPDRKYVLFDSFEGLPLAKEIDGAAAHAWQANLTGPMYHNNCRAAQEEAEQAMSMSVAKNYSIVKGWFSDTLPNAEVGPIALLRLDADWYDSTKEILHNLANRVVRGGLLLIDDYYAYEGCAVAVNEFAAARKWMIRQHRKGEVCHIIVP